MSEKEIISFLSHTVKNALPDTKETISYIPLAGFQYTGKTITTLLKNLNFAGQTKETRIAIVEHFFRDYVFGLTYEDCFVFSQKSYSTLGALKVYSIDYYHARVGFGKEHTTNVYHKGSDKTIEKKVTEKYTPPNFALDGDKVVFSYWGLCLEPGSYNVVYVAGSVDEKGILEIRTDPERSWAVKKMITLGERIEEVKGYFTMESDAPPTEGRFQQ